MNKLKITGYNVLYGGATYNVSGFANYSIEDIGIGSFEYWGQKGHDSYLTVIFESMEIEDIVLENKIEWREQHLTETDISNISEIIIEELNSNRVLCDETAFKH